MKISKIKINNFRLLRDFEIDLESQLSLVIGKNNCGKTIFISIIEKFIGAKHSLNSFLYDDFNIEFQQKLQDLIEGDNPILDRNSYGITLKVFIEYDEEDNLAKISELMMDLDPNNKTVVLGFEYSIQQENFMKLKNDYNEYVKQQKNKVQQNFKEIGKKQESKKEKELENVFNSFHYFLKENHRSYFKVFKKAMRFDYRTMAEVNEDYIDLVKENISLDKILTVKIINARRSVANQDNNRALSLLSSRYYENLEAVKKGSNEIEKFKEALSGTDKELNKVYEKLFDKIIKKVELFGGIKKGDSVIKIISTLEHKELLKGNTTVTYKHNEAHSLPESYNGLGYMNLISMIFEIEILLNEFRKGSKEDEEPACINLLFIEEPEAHTHPQMQSIFIKNIKDILNKSRKGEDEQELNLQTILTTHSSQIVAESDFNDIKYFYKKDQNNVLSKNLKDLEKEYEKDGYIQYYKFLKQYLTLHRADLFFADKAVFIEGDTERILLPAMMKKIDQENIKEIPLLSQNISIVEVGAYSHIFEKFIDFIGVKSLIITDIDSATIGRKKCRVDDPQARITTNASLEFFYRSILNNISDKKNKIQFFKQIRLEGKRLLKDKSSNTWVQNKNGNLLIIYQTSEKNSKGDEYHARSFEDAFFHINKQFIISNSLNFGKSLTNIDYFQSKDLDVYDLAEKCVYKKPSFALDILLNSKTDEDGNEFSNWEIPEYIREGLLWLQQY